MADKEDKSIGAVQVCWPDGRIEGFVSLREAIRSLRLDMSRATVIDTKMGRKHIWESEN